MLNVILEWIYLIHLLGIFHLLVSGQSSGIRLVGDSETFKGKVELRANGYWLAICYDGDSDRSNWNRAAATVACRQLGYDAGWEGSRLGVTRDYSLEGFECSTDSDSSLNECSHDGYEYCGCSTFGTLNPFRCGDHEQEQEQAFVECYNFSDISLHLEEMNGGDLHEGKLKVLYRGDLYDVCYQGSDTDDHIWSMDEANVACRQLGYQLGGVRTGRFDGGSDIPKYFDDFTCNNEGVDNLFSCFPDPPNESGCGSNNTVFLECRASPSSVSTMPSSPTAPTTVASTTGKLNNYLD
ncbi:neurotrypsin-like [Amphiura filiformis]|uniref:neurotrypsin-like n=1 Tax=Amphiura filiformis TaxID=82378 RepID=UPI003B211874